LFKHRFMPDARILACRGLVWRDMLFYRLLPWVSRVYE
jgi:hypothetical protein